MMEDPGNLLYVQGTIDTAAQLVPMRWQLLARFRRWILLGEVEKAAQEPRQLLALAPRVAELAMDHVPTLLSLAMAAAEVDLAVVGALYARAAQRAAEGDAKIEAEVASTLRKLGLFDDAAGSLPIAIRPDLAPGAPVSNSPAPPHTRDEYLTRAEQLVSAEQFDEAQRVLAEAQSAHGSDLAIRHAAEEVILAKSRHRLSLAKLEHESAPGEITAKLVAELAADLAREEIRVFGSRAERHPGDRSHALRLGEALARAGNHRQAITWLETASLDPAQKALAQTLLGESLQSLKLFEKAVASYRLAVAASEPNPPDINHSEESTWARCRYRLAVLLAAMNAEREALDLLEEVARLQPGYKQTSGHLDKLRLICHKEEFPHSQSAAADRAANVPREDS